MTRVRWNHYEIMRPDWVMLGVPHPEGVVLYASTSLSRGELVRRAEEVDIGELLARPRMPPAASFDLTVTLTDYTLVFAKTYAEALVRLLGSDWTPDAQRHDPAGIEASRPAIESESTDG